MYLRRLSQPAKEVFIDIAKYLCNADGIVDKREEKLLAAYGEELQMTISLDAPQKSLEALATNLNAATDRIQKTYCCLRTDGACPCGWNLCR